MPRVADLGDEPAFRERAEQISRRHTDSVAELADLGLVKTATAQVRALRWDARPARARRAGQLP